MTKQEFLRKISSRKFQAAVVAIIIPLLALLKVDEPTKGEIVAMVTAVLACLGYMFAEATVDAARAKAPQFIEVIESDETLENHGGGGYSPKLKKGEYNE